MDYGIPIPKPANIKPTKTLTLLTNVDYDTALENVFNNLVEELGGDAYKSDWVGGGDDSYTYYSLNLPNFYNASGVVVSWESLIGLVFDDFHNSVPPINTKWTTGWSRMYYNTEPDIFFCIRPQDNSNDLGMNGSRIAYYDDRVIVFADYHFRDGNKNNNFKIVIDFKKNTESYYGVDTRIYYMSSGNNLNPYVWCKLFQANQPTNIEVLSADRNLLKFQNGSYTLTKYQIEYDTNIEYINNIKFDVIPYNTSFKQKLNFKNNSILNLTRVKERTYHEIVNRRAIDWIPRNYNPLSFNISEKFGDIITNNKRPSQHLVDTQKISLLYNYIDVKGFIEGKTNEDKIYAKFLNSADYGVLQIIDSFEYDFRLYSSYSNFLLLLDGRLRKIDIKNRMLKGYISGKINTSGCSGQDFIIRCYRHSNNDFIGEYAVDMSGNYFIPNLNYLDEYDIMLVDKNTVIETKVSSKRKPILNDEIKELKLQAHMSNTGYDVFSKIKYKSLLDNYGIWIWNLASTMATENVNFLKDIRNPDYETLFENTEDFCFYNYKHVTNSWSSDTGWVNNFLIDKSPIGKVFEVHLYNGTYSYTCADTHLEFKDDDDNIIAVMKFERDSSYQSGIWYGTSWNTITKASQSGSYPQTTGILEFLNDRIVYTNTRNTGGWNNSFTYMNSNLHKVTKINVLKARAYMDYPNTHTQFRMVEIEVE